jgi:Arc/MetJ family transcription regulator
LRQSSKSIYDAARPQLSTALALILTVYHGVEMRTNVELDDRLVSEVMRRYRLKTKREAVDLALRRLVDEPLDPAQALALEGSGWDADLAEVRESRRAAS